MIHPLLLMIFMTNILKATGDDDALEPLRERYNAQHYRLVKFYYECSNLGYLTRLITIPKLPQDPPNLLANNDDSAESSICFFTNNALAQDNQLLLIAWQDECLVMPYVSAIQGIV